MATSPPEPLRLLVGVTGGVAAFKTAALVSQLVQRGVDVQVVMTRDARRFVGPATFAALTGSACSRSRSIKPIIRSGRTSSSPAQAS